MGFTLRTVFAWVLCFAAVGAWAQIPAPPSQGEETVSVPSTLANPRATVRTFLEAMNEEREKDASAALDLSGINLVLRDTEGPRLARMLFDVLNRTLLIKLDRIPETPEGETVVIVRPRKGTDRELGAIEVARSSDGAWRFSKATLESLPAIWEVARNQPVIEGLVELDAREVDPGEWLRGQVPAGWSRQVLWLEQWQWVFLAALALLTALFHLLSRIVIGLALRFRFKVAGKRLSENVRRGLRRSVAWILSATLIVATLPYLDLPELLGAPLLLFARLMQFGTGVWMLFAVWDAVMEAVADRASNLAQRVDTILLPIASKFGKFIIFAVCSLLFAASLGINLAGLLAGLGIGGLVLALAAKDSVENVFGSLTILFDMPFGIGDWVKIGTIDGTVEEINLRSTRIRTTADSVITVPNSNMIKAAVENLGARRYRRLRLPLALTYETSAEKIEQFCEGLRERIREHPKTRKDKFYVELNDLSESSLDVLLILYFEADTYGEELALRSAFLLDVKRFAESIGVQFAFPSRTLYMQPAADPEAVASNGAAEPGD